MVTSSLMEVLRCVGVIAGVFVCYGLSSLTQEWILKVLHYPHSIVLTISISLPMAVVTGLAGGFRDRKAPILHHCAVGFLSLSSVGLSNYALIFLNFGTQLICKSSKIIPVMVIGTLVWKKRHACLTYVAAVTLIAGLVLFVLGDRAVSPDFNPFGLVIISGALLADAFIGNKQQALMEQGATKLECMAWMGLTSAGMSLVPLMTSDLQEVFEDTTKDLRIPAGLLVLGLVNVVGMFFIMLSLKTLGAAQTVFWTSLRKALSLALSFVLWPKPISPRMVLGAALVFAAIGLNTFQMTRAKKQKAAATAAATAAAVAAAAEALSPEGSATAPRLGDGGDVELSQQVKVIDGNATPAPEVTHASAAEEENAPLLATTTSASVRVQ